MCLYLGVLVLRFSVMVAFLVFHVVAALSQNARFCTQLNEEYSAQVYFGRFFLTVVAAIYSAPFLASKCWPGARLPLP